jgi:acetolactate synthase-1/2/3 large subunit
MPTSLTGRIPEAVQKAFRMATSGKPGAVHLDIPEDVIYSRLMRQVSVFGARELPRHPSSHGRPCPG